MVRNAAGKAIAEDDDGGEGTNSRLLFIPEADGNYEIVVTAFEAAATGTFLLRIQEYQPAGKQQETKDKDAP